MIIIAGATGQLGRIIVEALVRRVPTSEVNVRDAAKAAGARRVVYTSQMDASPPSPFPPMHDHAATKAMLAGSGLA